MWRDREKQVADIHGSTSFELWEENISAIESDTLSVLCTLHDSNLVHKPPDSSALCVHFTHHTTRYDAATCASPGAAGGSVQQRCCWHVGLESSAGGLRF